jgi:hypothetical protein
MSQRISSEGAVILGLDEFRRNLRKIDVGLGKELGQFNKQVGTHVLDHADKRRQALKGRYGSYSTRWKGGRGVTLKASSDQRRVSVTVRPAAAEFGLDGHKVFGRYYANRDLKRQVWPVWSGNQFVSTVDSGVGYMVFPTIRDELPQIVDFYVSGITEFARSKAVQFS